MSVNDVKSLTREELLEFATCTDVGVVEPRDALLWVDPDAGLSASHNSAGPKRSVRRAELAG